MQNIIGKAVRPIDSEGYKYSAQFRRMSIILNSWNFIFDHKVSPLRHIPDVAVRHYVLQILGLMWAVSFSAAIGSYVFLAASIIGHVILIAAAAITIATLTTAAKNPKLFSRGAGRRNDGEHE